LIVASWTARRVVGVDACGRAARVQLAHPFLVLLGLRLGRALRLQPRDRAVGRVQAGLHVLHVDLLRRDRPEPGQALDRDLHVRAWHLQGQVGGGGLPVRVRVHVGRVAAERRRDVQRSLDAVGDAVRRRHA